MLPRLSFAAARITPLVVVAVGAAALVTGCGSSGGAAPTSSSAAPSPSGSIEVPSPAAPSSAEAPSPTASVPDDPAYAVADAITDQLSTTPADALSDALVTIAVSPQLRQLASAYGVTTAIDVKGAQVILTIEGGGQTCEVVVADAPTPARGFTCE